MDELKDSILPINSIFDPDKIDHGQYGSVYSAKYKHDTIAIKVLSDQVELTDREQTLFVAIAKRMRTFPKKCDVLIKSYGVLMKPRWYSVVTDYFDQGTLTKHLARYYFPYALSVRLWRDVAMAMKFLHGQSPPLLHLDLKGSNILFTKDFHGKLCDYGLAEWKTLEGSYIFGEKTKQAPEDSVPEIKKIQDVSHIPPEIWNDLNSPSTKEFDVYSFGILMWHSAARQLPYETQPIEKRDMHTVGNVIEMVKKGERPDMKFMHDIPHESVTMMTQCWSQKQMDRPSFSDLLKQLDKTYKTIEDEIEESVHGLNNVVNGRLFCKPLSASERKRRNEPSKSDRKSDDSKRELAEMLIRAVQNQSRLEREQGEGDGKKSSRNTLRHLHPLIDMISKRGNQNSLVDAEKAGMSNSSVRETPNSSSPDRPNFSAQKIPSSRETPNSSSRETPKSSSRENPNSSSGKIPISSSRETPMQLGSSSPPFVRRANISSSSSGAGMQKSSPSCKPCTSAQNEEPMEVESKDLPKKQPGGAVAGMSGVSMPAFPTQESLVSSTVPPVQIPSDNLPPPTGTPQTTPTTAPTTTDPPSGGQAVRPPSGQAPNQIPNNSSDFKHLRGFQSVNIPTSNLPGASSSTKGNKGKSHKVKPGWNSRLVEASPGTITYTEGEDGSVHAVHVEGMQNFHIGPTTVTHIHKNVSYQEDVQDVPTPSTNFNYFITESVNPVKDMDIGHVADNIPAQKWRQLAETLGLHTGEIDALDSDYHVDGDYEKGYQALRKWKLKNGNRATLKLLAQALISVDLPAVATTLGAE